MSACERVCCSPAWTYTTVYVHLYCSCWLLTSKESHWRSGSNPLWQIERSRCTPIFAPSRSWTLQLLARLHSCTFACLHTCTFAQLHVCTSCLWALPTFQYIHTLCQAACMRVRLLHIVWDCWEYAVTLDMLTRMQVWNLARLEASTADCFAAVRTKCSCECWVKVQNPTYECCIYSYKKSKATNDFMSVGTIALSNLDTG